MRLPFSLILNVIQSYKNTPDKEGIETLDVGSEIFQPADSYKNTPDKEGIETASYPVQPSATRPLGYKNTPDKEGIETRRTLRGTESIR